jgi:hypothetical protein
MSAGSSHDVGVQWVGDISTTDQLLPPIDRWFYNDSGSTISANNSISADLSKTPRLTRVRQYTGTPATDGNLIVAGAIQDVKDDKWGPFRIRGVVSTQKVAAGTAAGRRLVAGAAAGTLKASAAYSADETPVAIALTAEAGGLAEVFYTNPLGL